MLYIVTFIFMTLWMIAVLRKKQLSWHSVVASYCIAVFSADLLEVSFNLLLNLYKFPTHLLTNPIDDNELGIIFSDTLILPFVLIVFVYYAAKRNHPWRISLLFAIGWVSLEWVYLKLGYLKYLNWSLAFSACFYVIGFRFAAFLAPRIATYNPPVPYWYRLLCFSHTFIMWVGALFGSPLLKMFQFKPGVFEDYMADCRFTDLLSGDVLSVLCVLILPRTSQKFKPVAVALIACIGIAFAMYSFNKGWLIYHQWNHFLTVLRYLLPLALILIYDRWEFSYTGNKSLRLQGHR